MEENQLTNEENNKEETKEEEKSLSMELLEEQKRQNVRLSRIMWGLIALCGFIIAVFLLYLHSYDFSATVEQEGVYVMLDSDGNVISSDLSSEQLVKLMEILDNGKDSSSEKEN